MSTPPFEVLSPADLRRRTSLKWRHHGPDVLPLWVAEMDVLPPPEVVDVLSEAIRSGDTGYPGTGQLYAEAFAEFAEASWAWAPSPADTLFCADVMTGIRALVEALTGPRGTVVIPSPVYPPFAVFARELGRTVDQVRLADDGRLDLAGIEAALTSGGHSDGPAVLLLCSPHNPTGVVHSRDELVRLAEVADRHGAAVVADEVHAPLVPPGAAFVPWLSVVDTGFVVTSGAKAFNLPGLKAGVIVAGPAERRRLRGLPESVQYGASHLGILAHAAAWRADPSWIAAVNDNISVNRELLRGLLAEHMPTVGYQVPAATYLAWLDCRALGLGDDPAADLLRLGRVALTPGPPFGPGGQGRARLNLACSRQVLTEAVERMAAVVATQPPAARAPA